MNFCHNEGEDDDPENVILSLSMEQPSYWICVRCEVDCDRGRKKRKQLQKYLQQIIM